MSNEQDEYILGEDVTAAATVKGRRGTSVLSVRVSNQELARLDALSQMTGKTFSQIVREALDHCYQLSRESQPAITVVVQGGSSVSTGRVQPATKAATAASVALT
jgi:predicted transcriptional regulator